MVDSKFSNGGAYAEDSLSTLRYPVLVVSAILPNVWIGNEKTDAVVVPADYRRNAHSWLSPSSSPLAVPLAGTSQTGQTIQDRQPSFVLSRSYHKPDGAATMIVCDLCGQAKECIQTQVNGNGHDIRLECWNRLANKLRGKGTIRFARSKGNGCGLVAVDFPSNRTRKAEAAWTTAAFLGNVSIEAFV